MRTIPVPVAVLATALVLGTGVLGAQEQTAPSPQITIEAVTIEPSSPAADTLCKLQVTLKNHGSEIASQLDFKVKINDQMLPVYRNQLFMFPLKAGETSDLKLYNFWSTETSRPMPKDGKLIVEVSLVAAQWTKVSMEEDVEVWQPLGEVEGLPHSQSVTLKMKP
jgi:hypothetical protein